MLAMTTTPALPPLAPETLERLKRVSTATLCTRLFKAGFRSVLVGLLRGADDPVDARTASTLAVLVIAGIEGLSLERIERGETAALGRARELFVRSIVASLPA